MGRYGVIHATWCLLCFTVALILAGCGGDGRAIPETATGAVTPAPRLTAPALLESPTVADLQVLLDAELARLRDVPDRETADVEPGDEEKVFNMQAVQTGTSGDEVYTGTVELRWVDILRGDYNQDGAVTAADLTPLAQHWHKTVEYDDPELHDGIAWWPSGDPYDGSAEEMFNWRLAMIDGNRNGLIEAADITVIAQHWNQCIEGYRMFRCGPLPDNTHFRSVGIEVAVEYRSGMPGADGNRPVVCSFTDRVPVAGNYECTLLTFGENLHSWSLREALDGVDANSAPEAKLWPSPTYGRCPMEVDFRLWQSEDPEGLPLSYELLIDGESAGVLPAGSDPPHRFKQVFNEVGKYTACLRVTDVKGAQALSEERKITVVDNIPPKAIVYPEWGNNSGPAPFTARFILGSIEDLVGEVVEILMSEVNDAVPYKAIPVGTNYHDVTLEEPGDYTFVFRVTDNEGATDTCSVDIEVTE